MKNAMKKLMAFALVAVMLIGTLPFAASAAECSKSYGCTAETGTHREGCPEITCGTAGPDGVCDHGGWNHSDTCPQRVYACSKSDACRAEEYSGVHQDGCPKDPANAQPEPEPQPEPLDPTDTNNCTLKEDCPVVVPYHKEGCLAVAKSDVAIDDGKKCTNSYDCPHRGNLHVAGCPMIPCSSDASCDHGGWNHTPDCPFACRNSDACHADYHLDTCPKNKVEEPNEPENDTNSNGNGTGNNVNDYFGDEALSPVWLYIYTNDNLNHPTKMINITNYTITDDTITKKEVLTVIDDYYKASNSNNGIIWKGMYMEYDDSNTSSLDIYQWVYGNIGDAVYGVNEARTKGTVIIMARVTGVTTVSSAAADNSNPKTGDQIFAPVAIMAVSACALAAVAFYLNKKRAM